MFGFSLDFGRGVLYNMDIISGVIEKDQEG